MTQTLSIEPREVSSAVGPKGPFLVLDREEFLPRFNVQACFVRHRLTDHPFLTIPSLLELAKKLPSRYVRINSGNVPVDATPDQIPGNGLSMEDSFNRIEETDTRIMLKKIELHPEYRDLLYTCLAEIEALGHPVTRGIWARRMKIWASATPAFRACWALSKLDAPPPRIAMRLPFRASKSIICEVWP